MRVGPSPDAVRGVPPILWRRERHASTTNGRRQAAARPESPTAGAGRRNPANSPFSPIGLSPGPPAGRYGVTIRPLTEASMKRFFSVLLVLAAALLTAPLVAQQVPPRAT